MQKTVTIKRLEIKDIDNGEEYKAIHIFNEYMDYIASKDVSERLILFNDSNSLVRELCSLSIDVDSEELEQLLLQATEEGAIVCGKEMDGDEIDEIYSKFWDDQGY